MLVCCRVVVQVYNSETSNKRYQQWIVALERWSLNDINRWYNTSVYQRSNEATKEWCNKQKRIGMAYTHWPASMPALQPACRPACLPTGLPARLPVGTQTGKPTNGLFANGQAQI